MADTALNIERASGYATKAVSNKTNSTTTKVKLSCQAQFAIAFYLFTGGVGGAITMVLCVMMQEGVFLY